jgi:hypothetical protein
MKNTIPYDKEECLGLKMEGDDVLSFKIVTGNIADNPSYYSDMVKAGADTPPDNIVSLGKTPPKLVAPNKVENNTLISQTTGAKKPNSVSLNKGTDRAATSNATVSLKPTVKLVSNPMSEMPEEEQVMGDNVFVGDALEAFFNKNPNIAL